MRRALITGISGQDGAYLAQFLLSNGYHVIGTSRAGTGVALDRLHYLGVALTDVKILPFGPGLADKEAESLIERTRPDEVYNLAGHSFVATSFSEPAMVACSNAVFVAQILRAIRVINPSIRYFQASSSEMFGQTTESPQNEDSPLRPRNPYASAKLFAHWLTLNHRQEFGLHASSGICFNHESPIRGAEFVTRKITMALASIRRGSSEILELGNLDARRDWGFAGDYVEAMWRMLQAPKGADYVIATGKTETVRSFVELTAAALDIPLAWAGSGLSELGVDRRSGRVIVQVSKKFYRPTETYALVGNPAKALIDLGWRARTGLAELVANMAAADYNRLKHRAAPLMFARG